MTRERRGVGGSREGGVGGAGREEWERGSREGGVGERKQGGRSGRRWSREREERDRAALSRRCVHTVKHRYTYQHMFSDHFPAGSQ